MRASGSVGPSLLPGCVPSTPDGLAPSDVLEPIGMTDDVATLNDGGVIHENDGNGGQARGEAVKEGLALAAAQRNKQTKFSGVEVKVEMEVSVRY